MLFSDINSPILSLKGDVVAASDETEKRFGSAWGNFKCLGNAPTCFNE
jgi:hypothetical protein